MKTKIGDIVRVWGEVFSKWNYILLAAVLALLFYAITVLFTNFRFIISLSFFRIFPALLGFMRSYPDFFPLYYFIGTIILSLLFGIMFSLIMYKTKAIKSAMGKGGILASLGIFLGIISPSCSAYCGIGLLSTIGISSAFLNFLPLKGFEFVILSIIILLVVIYSISNQINKGIVCEIPKSK